MKSIFYLFLFLTPFFASTQISTGGEPFSIDWQQINTDKFRIIYEKGLDTQAFRVASIIDYIYDSNYKSIGTKRRKINLLLHNHTSISNGFVATPPFRSEFFASAPLQSANLVGSGDWLDLLSIHEYRHVLQYANTRQGISTLIQILVGDIGIGFTSVLTIPSWFSEGDAVVTETALTELGRGRMPFFSAQQRAIIFNDKKYTYAKWKSGSYKDLLPNHYAVGYQICNYARNEYGNDAWQPVYKDAVRFKYIGYPMSRSFKRHYKTNTKKLCFASLDDLKLKYQNYLDSIGTTTSELVLTDNTSNEVAIYGQPYFLSNDEIYCVKSTFKDLAKIIHIDASGKETKICELGNNQIGNYFDFHGDKFIWAENFPDPRREYVNYMNLVEYNLTTKKKKILTHKTRYQSPSYSNDGSKIVVVETTSELKNYLVILNASDGEVVQRFECPYYPTYPQWLPTGDGLLFSARHENRSFLCEFSFSSNSFTKLTQPSPNSIGIPRISGQKVYFSATFNGIDNIYEFDLDSKICNQITSVKIGAYEPAISPDGNVLVMSEYLNENGKKLTKTSLNSLPFYSGYNIPTQRSSELDENLLGIKAMKVEGGDILDDLEIKNFEVSKYQRSLHMLHLHSWYMYYWPQTFNVGLQSDNILGTFSINTKYTYDVFRKTSSITGSFTYAGFYPLISGDIVQTLNKNIFINDPSLPNQELIWDEKTAKIGLSLPLDFSKFQYSRSLNLGAYYSISTIDYNAGESMADYDLQAIHLEGNFSNLKFRARKHIHSRFGQEILVKYEKSMTDASEQFRFRSILYFPGLAKTHNFYLDFEYESRNIGAQNYGFFDEFTAARGYATTNFFNNQLRFSANYSHPIAYPDFGIHGLFFIKRFRNNYFYDFSKITHSSTFDSNYPSFGIETLADVTIFDILPVSIGFRYSYLAHKTSSDPTNSMISFMFEITP